MSSSGVQRGALPSPINPPRAPRPHGINKNMFYGIKFKTEDNKFYSLVVTDCSVLGIMNCINRNYGWSTSESILQKP